MKQRIAVYVIISLIFLGFIIVKHFQKDQIIIEKKSNIEAVEPNLIPELPSFYEPIPNTNITNNLSWMGDDYNYSITNNINSDGLNQTSNIPAEKKKDVFRIIALGDSFTFGANVNTKDNYPSQLQNLLNNSCSTNIKFEVLNLGVSGYDTQYVEERMRIKGMKYKPDLAIWFIVVDDLERINRISSLKSQYYYRKLNSTEQGRELLKRSPYTHLVMAMKDVVKELGEQKVLDIQRKYLNEMRTFYKNPLVFFTYKNNRIKRSHNNFLKSYVSSGKNIFFYDQITDIYEKNGLLHDKHPNSYGYKLMADDVFNYLKKEKLINCN